MYRRPLAKDMCSEIWFRYRRLACLLVTKLRKLRLLYARNGECIIRVCNHFWECLGLSLRLEFVLGGYTCPSGLLQSLMWDSVSIEER